MATLFLGGGVVAEAIFLCIAEFGDTRLGRGILVRNGAAAEGSELAMDGGEARAVEELEEDSRYGDCLRVIGYCLRAIASYSSNTAALYMILYRESTLVDGINRHINYNSSPIHQFFAWVNLCVGIYGMISWVIHFHLNSEGPPARIYYRTLFLLELMMGLVLGAGIAGEITFLIMAENGNSHMAWFGVCDHFKKFCSRSKLSLGWSLASLSCYLPSILLLYLPYRDNINNRVNY